MSKSISHSHFPKQKKAGEGAVSPEIAANLAVFLASEASGNLTGKLIAAPYNPWREWAGKADELNATPLYTVSKLAFIQLLAQHGILYFTETPEELESEVAGLELLLGKES